MVTWMFRNLYLDYIRIESRLCFLYLLLKIVLETLQYSLLQRYVLRTVNIWIVQIILTEVYEYFNRTIRANNSTKDTIRYIDSSRTDPFLTLVKQTNSNSK